MSTPAPEVPRFLFRTWTDQSNGTNTPTVLKSAWRSWNDRSVFTELPFPRQRSTLRSKLQGALMGREIKVNPFLFTTCSLLYAIQHAIDKTRGKAQSNAYIICIDTKTCERPDGGDVRFYQADQVMAKYGLPTPKARWTQQERDYADVWVTTDTIVPGKNSYYVSFDTLKDVGLFKLYPELGHIARSANPGLETPVRQLRRHRYSRERDLRPEQFSLAAKLAAAFEPVKQGVGASPVPPHPLAWFIALKGQQSQGRRLGAWLMTHSSRSTAQSVRPYSLQDPNVPERARYLQILAVLRLHSVSRARIDAASVRIPRDRLEMQLQSFKDGKRKAKSSGRSSG